MPTVEDVTNGGRPAVLVANSAPYAIVDANDAWLSACSFGSRDQVVGHTLSIIQGPRTEPVILAELMEGVHARVPIIDVTLTNYDARRRPFRNELTVEPINFTGEAYFLATCTITMLSKRGRRITLRRSATPSEGIPVVAPMRGGRGVIDRDQLASRPGVMHIPVSYEVDFSADFTRLLSIPSLVEQILFSLEAPWAARASLVCKEWRRALNSAEGQQYWRRQCARHWGVSSKASLRLAEGMSSCDWRWIYAQAQRHSAPVPVDELRQTLENPHSAVKTESNELVLDARADAVFDRSVRTAAPLFRVHPPRAPARQHTWGLLPAAAGGVASKDATPTWQVTQRKTAYFEVEVGQREEPIPDRAQGNECIAIGFVHRSFVLEGRQPGWDASTWGYHSDDGRLYTGTGLGTEFAPAYGEGDTVGCGVFQSAGGGNDLCFFFTKNGVLLGGTCVDAAGAGVPGELFACVGLSSFSTCRLNFGERPMAFDLLKWEHLLVSQADPAPPGFAPPQRVAAREEDEQADIPAGGGIAEGEAFGGVRYAVAEAASALQQEEPTWLAASGARRRNGRFAALLNCVAAPAHLGVALGVNRPAAGEE